MATDEELEFAPPESGGSYKMKCDQSNRKCEFYLNFGQDTDDYKCMAKISKKPGASNKLRVKCEIQGVRKASFRCTGSKITPTSFGRVKLHGDECTLVNFELKKALEPKDPGIAFVDKKAYFDKNFTAVVERIDDALTKETVIK